MSAPTDLAIAKKNLQQNLGDDMKMYLQNLRSWFKQKITKEEFDAEARGILSPESVHLHNEFLLAIISRCQTLSSSLVPKDSLLTSSGKMPDFKHKVKINKFKRRPLASRVTLQQKYVPAPLESHIPVASYRGVEQHHSFASREHSLPDISMVHGRMLVCAWENGLEEVNDAAVKLVMKTVESQLKNILSLIISRRSGYKLREKRMRYAQGGQAANPYVRQSQLLDYSMSESEATSITEGGVHVPCWKPHTELAEGVAMREVSVTQPPIENPPISLFDLLQTLQLYRSSIPSHSVYAPAVERVIHKLWHPSQEEINQDIINHQEILLKQTHPVSGGSR